MTKLNDNMSIHTLDDDFECDGCGDDVEEGNKVLSIKGMNEQIFVCLPCVDLAASHVTEEL